MIISKVLKKTYEYISSVKDRTRVGHHVFVVERKVCNLIKPLNLMNDLEINKFDDECFEYLKYLDTNKNEE